VDDALMVTNLVYFGTLMIGGVLLLFLGVATVITLVIAGTGQGAASLVMAALRALRDLVRRLAAHEEPAATSEEARAEYARRAVVAKADAILAARKAAAEAASVAAADAREPRRPESEEAATGDEEIAVPAALAAGPAYPALAHRLSVPAEPPRAAPARTAETAVVARMRPARPLPRTGPHTGTQPVLVVSRAS
jgi:hypothetical protein